MLKKSIAVLTAVAAIASASSVFAADYADQVVKLTDSEKAETLTDATAQYTVVIVDKKTGNEAVTLSADDLYYINQGTSADTFWTNMGTKTALTAGKTYTIRIGSNIENFTAKEYDFTVAADPVTGTTITFKWGDINNDGAIDLFDAIAALRTDAGKTISTTINGVTLTTGTQITASKTEDSEQTVVFKWGDINNDGAIDLFDAIAALRTDAGKTISTTINDVTVTTGTSMTAVIPTQAAE